MTATRTFEPGDRVRFRGMPGLGVGRFVRVTATDAHTGRPFRCECQVVGLDEGREYVYSDFFAISDLVRV